MHEDQAGIKKVLDDIIEHRRRLDLNVLDHIAQLRTVTVALLGQALGNHEQTYDIFFMENAAIEPPPGLARSL